MVFGCTHPVTCTEPASNRLSASPASKKCSVVYKVPIRLEWQEPILPILANHQGKVVTETTTEYKEATDDSGFSDFNNAGQFQSFSTTSGSLGGPAGFPLKSSEAKAADSSSSSSSEDESEDKFEEAALEAHNEYRKKHGVAALKLDKKLCSYAQEWADKLAKTDSFEHRTNQELGENLFCSWSSNHKAKCPGDKPVDSWYSEIKSYNFGSEPTSLSSGHFTQVVWKTSKKLGIAKARSPKSGKTIVVANYEPAGNWVGQYKENVLAPLE